MKIRAIITPLIISFLCAFAPKSYATHIVGGEMTYRCLGNNQYEISLTIFRDCDTGIPWFDNPASIGVFSATTGAYIQGVGIDTLGNNNDTIPIFLPDSCLTVPSNVCIHTMTYKDTINLPFRAGGYVIAYQRCCRNQDIVNIVDPDDAGATYWTFISEQALDLFMSRGTHCF